MKRLTFLFALCLSALCAWSQVMEYADELRIVSNTGTKLVIETTGFGNNDRDAKFDAAKKVVNTLVFKGVDEIDNHNPICAAPVQALKSRVNSDNYCARFVEIEGMEVLAKGKAAKGKQLRVKMTVKYEALKEDINKTIGAKPAQLQQLPTLTVVPYVKENEDINQLLDDNPWVSYSVTSLSSAFGDYGYKVKDYQQLLKLVENNAGLTADSKKDYATLLIENGMTDIVVTVRPVFSQNGSGQKSASLEMKATETMTASTLSQQTVSTRFLNNKTPQMLVDEAIEMSKRQFFGKLKKEFFDMAQNGREVNITISIDQNADWDFDQDTPTGKDFQDLFSAWLEEHTKSHDLLDHVATYIIRGNAYVPMWNFEKNKAIRLGEFARELRRFFKNCLNDEYEIKSTVQGQNIVLTIK